MDSALAACSLNKKKHQGEKLILLKSRLHPIAHRTIEPSLNKEIKLFYSMASVAQSAAPQHPVLENTQVRGGDQQGGRSDQGGYREGRQNAQEQSGLRGGRRGGRGNRGQEAGLNSSQRGRKTPSLGLLPAPSIPPPPGLGGGGSFGDRPAEDANTTKGERERTMAPDEEVDVEAEVCFICASPVEHNCIAPCNHRTCHICALRMRALYKKTECTHCRVLIPFVGSSSTMDILMLMIVGS